MTIHASFSENGMICDYCKQPVTIEDTNRCYDGSPHCEDQKVAEEGE